MTAWKLRDEIAKERFLDMLAGAEPTIEQARLLAIIAVQQSDILIEALTCVPPGRGVPVLKVCPACNGKCQINSRQLCGMCSATGKVPA